MATNATDTGPVSSSAASPSLSDIHPLLDFLILSHTFTTLLIPLLISLFYFSTLQGRRRPIFILNVVAVLFAFVLCVLCVGVTMNAILEPLSPWSEPAHLTIRFIGVMQSIIVDLTLLLRVISIYPLALLGLRRFSLLLAIPVLLKLVRVINLILFTAALVDVTNRPDVIVMIESPFSSLPYVKVEWAAQLIDNTYVSVAFLLRVRLQGNHQFMTHSGTAERMRILFTIALTNFVVPAIFSIVQFACVYRNVSMVVLDQIILVNTMLATFGVAFATVWAGSANRQEAYILGPKYNNTAKNLATPFRGGPVPSEDKPSTATIAGSGVQGELS